MTSKLIISIAALLCLAATACGSCDPAPAASGSASVAWSITALGHPVTCTQAGAAAVSLRMHSRASGADITSVFPCTDVRATTTLAVGAYDASLTLQAADGAALEAAAPQLAVTILTGQVAGLAPVAFVVSDRGKLSLSFATLGTMRNCAPHDQGGAGITANKLTLVRAADGCEPVTFVRSRGGSMIGTYTVDCGTPQVAACIERDETLTAEGVDAGPLVLSVSGLIGPVGCWGGVDVLLVPAGGALVKPIQLAPNPSPQC